MNVLIFGGSYRQVATTKKAADNVANYGTEVAENLTNNLYVDKILRYVSNEETNKTDVRGKKHVCRQVPPYTFASKGKLVQTSIPENESRKGFVLDKKLKFQMFPRNGIRNLLEY